MFKLDWTYKLTNNRKEHSIKAVHEIGISKFDLSSTHAVFAELFITCLRTEIWILHYLTTFPKHVIKNILNKSKRYSSELLFQNSHFLENKHYKYYQTCNLSKKSGLSFSSRRETNLNIKTLPIIIHHSSRYIDYVGVKLYNFLQLSIKLLNNLKMFREESKLYI